MTIPSYASHSLGVREAVKTVDGKKIVVIVRACQFKSGWEHHFSIRKALRTFGLKGFLFLNTAVLFHKGRHIRSDALSGKLSLLGLALFQIWTPSIDRADCDCDLRNVRDILSISAACASEIPVDTQDLKSCARKGVPVQVWLGAPLKKALRTFGSRGFLLVLLRLPALSQESDLIHKLSCSH